MLDQELQKAKLERERLARQARFRAGNPNAAAVDDSFIFDDNKENNKPKGPILPVLGVKKDFFGRIIENTEARALKETNANGRPKSRAGGDGAMKGETKIWVTFHEGLNNAVRKPISLNELLRGL